MKFNRLPYCRILMLCLLLWIAGVDTASASDRINWRSYKEGMVLSKIEKKMVFLHFYADWCGYCRKMAQTTFKDAALIKYLNDNFIPIMVNSDNEPETASAYGVPGLPHNVFLTEMGEPIFSVPGYIKTDALMSMLKEVNAIKKGG